ncbi:MAG: EAL domain-containing protein [Ruminococcus sp.]|nr:EAL domain-containing protein [Ruminococcus sp.]
MYEFLPECREAYERQKIPLAYYQVEGGKPVPLLVSDGFCELMELGHDELIEYLQGAMFERLNPDDVGKVTKAVEDFVLGRNDYNIVYRSRLTFDGDERLIYSVGRRLPMSDGTELLEVGYFDITSVPCEVDVFTRTYIEQQKDYFYTDKLTDLPNLNYLYRYGGERVRVIKSSGKTPVLIFTDVNSMQFYNNQYGFAAGNELLQLVVKMIKKEFPQALIMRGADDHFIVLDAFHGQEETTARILRVNEGIKQGAMGNTTGLKYGICPLEGELRVTEALDHAKNALKRIGSDLNAVYRYFSYEADDKYWQQRYIIENFDNAIENGWIKVFYQGITRVETGKISAFEALARWVDPVRGIITPDEFIPVLEKYHLLYKLDLYMVEQVCREIPSRQKAGFPLMPVSVNFAAQDFDYVDIPAVLEDMYTKHGVPTSNGKRLLIIEITEQDIATATEKFHAQLQKLRESGFYLWLDDFGSGYSSLNVFSRFEFDLIKFDMELLKGLDIRNGANRRILKAMVGVAKELGVHTLIEGMETEGQREFLLEIGCELSQGYLFHRPEPLDSMIFRINGGQPIRACETEEEREHYSKKLFSDNA